MGQLWSRENKSSSPSESPLDESIPAGAAQVQRKLPFDPRSVSDDVSRTPIQIKDDDDEDEPTPGSGTKLLLSDSGVDEVKVAVETPSSAEILLQNKLKSLSLDPRSPSGIPRTPIVVEENSAKTVEQPKRGAVAAKIPATKLEFEENTELDKATLIQDEEIQVLAEEDASEEKEVEILQTSEDDVIVIEDDDAADEMKRHEEEEREEDQDMDDKSEGEALTDKSLENTMEEGEIRSSSEDEEENEEPELNLRPQKPLFSPVKTTVPRETGSAMTPNRVPLGDVDNKDKSLVI